MSTKKNDPKQAYRQIAGFGAALAAVAVAPHVDAAIISLTPTPGTVGWATLYTSTINPGGTTVRLVNGPVALSFDQFNFVSKNSTGFVAYAGKSFGWPIMNTGSQGLYNFIAAQRSSMLTTGMAWRSYIGPSQTSYGNATGTHTFGFMTQSGQLGWFQLNFGGYGGSITYLAAAFNDTPGAPIHVGDTGSTGVPEAPTAPLMALGLLALGATGVRKHRRRLREQHRNAV